MRKLLILVLLLISQSVYGQMYQGSGAFLLRGMSARALSMGGAYTALVNDASAVYWNPAGVVGKSEFSFQVSDLKELLFYSTFDDVNYPQGALTLSPRYRVFNYARFGIGIGYSGFFVKNIDRYDSQANYIDSFDFYEQAVFLSTGVEVDRFRIGLSWKIIQQDFGGFAQQSNLAQTPKGADIGIQFSPWKFLTLGLIIRDSLSVSEYDRTPRNTVVGLGLTFDRVRLATDLEFSSNYYTELHSGVEVFIGNKNQWRVGAGVRDLIVDPEVEIKSFSRINTKLNLGVGYTWRLLNGTRSLSFDISIQQGIFPEFLSPYSRVLVTSITLF